MPSKTIRRRTRPRQSPKVTPKPVAEPVEEESSDPSEVIDDKQTAVLMAEIQRLQQELENESTQGQEYRRKYEQYQQILSASSSNAAAKRNIMLRSFDDVNYDKNVWVVKASLGKDGEEITPDGDITIRSGKTEYVMHFKKGYSVTNDIRVARAARRHFNRRYACWKLEN